VVVLCQLSAPFRQQQLDQPEGSLRGRLQLARRRERIITGLSCSDISGDEFGQLYKVITFHQTTTLLTSKYAANRDSSTVIYEPTTSTLFMRSLWRDNHGLLAGFAESALSRYPEVRR
jgi:hypothetical protein